MNKLEFDPKDWEEITQYLGKWKEWRRKRKVGRPDSTSDVIYLVPFTIALIKSQNKIEKLTRILIALTTALVFLGVVELIKYFAI
ncbi:MAG: hypothetical protein JRI56_08095 [Deltaproteobacteria bacterium]|nr:hypothetical protein [Deltaproteobacteria bacterium]